MVDDHADGADPAYLEERADYVTEDVLREGTALGDFFDDVHKALVSKGLLLIVGPRGCGKTHMMRYTWLECCDQARLPFAVYASFNRYLRLEPLLGQRPDAIALFQTWVLGRILLAGDEASVRISGNADTQMTADLGLDRRRFEALVAKLERGAKLTEGEEEAARNISVEGVLRVISRTATRLGRRRTVLLLDDAALTLTPEYLVAFFDIVRLLRRVDIAPKASVYPGTTEYGPRFHATHEGRILPVWLSIEHERYSEIMQAIAIRRYPEGSSLPSPVREVFKYACFGIPRAYLTMLRDYALGGSTTHQQGANRVIELHSKARLEEYNSLMLKVPRLTSIVRLGNDFLAACISALKESNSQSSRQNEKQILIGLPEHIEPLPARMLNLLIEAGLLYELPSVSHGTERIYRRFIPHLANIIASRVFSGSPAQIVEQLERRQAKHPVRRSISRLLPGIEPQSWHLDLPNCQVCGASRISEAQKFCANCGQKLLDVSTFTRCMSINIGTVPNLTGYQIEQMRGRRIETIGDLLAIQDPGTELRRIPYIGPTRADRIISALEAYVDEFLS